MDKQKLSYQIRPLTLQDIPQCLDLAANRHWTPEEIKWRFLLTNGVGFGMETEDGSLVGSVTLMQYGTEAAVVGQVLVRDTFEGRGLGRQLMEYILDYAKEIKCVYLWATPLGKRLYDKLGFEVQDYITVHVGRFNPFTEFSVTDDTGLRIRPLEEQDFKTVLKLDEIAFGANREKALRAMLGVAQKVRVAELDNQIVGYGLSWQSRIINIGPLVALDDSVAKALLANLAAGQTLEVHIDLTSDFKEMADWVSANGMPAVASEPIMARGHLPGYRSQLYANFSRATG